MRKLGLFCLSSEYQLIVSFEQPYVECQLPLHSALDKPWLAHGPRPVSVWSQETLSQGWGVGGCTLLIRALLRSRQEDLFKSVVSSRVARAP